MQQPIAVLLILPNMTDGFIILMCDPALFKSEFFFLTNLNQALAEPHITTFNKFKYLFKNLWNKDSFYYLYVNIVTNTKKLYFWQWF